MKFTSKLVVNFIIAIFFILFFIENNNSFGQSLNDTLIGIVDGQLIKINRNNGDAVNYMNINNFPTTYKPYWLTWSEVNQCYFGIERPNPSTYNIFKVSASGNYSVLGPVTLTGNTVYMLEGISYNRFDSSLYVSASLNGNTTQSPPDYFCETLLKVDTTTLVGSIVGTFSHSCPYEPEADMISFDDNGTLYYEEGQPGNFERIYKQDIQFLNPPVLIYSSSYYPTSDFTVKGDTLYFSSNRDLMSVDITNYNYSVIGTMFSSTDFNGELLRGITWKTADCSQLDWLPTDTIFCSGSSVLIDGSLNGGTNYSWNNGVQTAQISVNSPGIYSLQVTQGSCVYEDSVQVDVSALPQISAGVNDTVCPGSDVVLYGSGAGSGGSYTWNNNVVNGQPFSILTSEDYVVTGVNSQGCESTDTVHIEVLQLNDPNFGYTDSSICVNSSPITPSYMNSSGGVFNSTPNGLDLNTYNGEINPSNSLPGLYTISYTITGAQCAVDSSFVIEILDKPVLQQINNVTICEGDPIPDIQFNSTPTSQVNWFNDNSSIGLSTNGNGDILGVISSITGGNPNIANLAVVPDNNGCIGDSLFFTITTKIIPQINANDRFACFGDSVEFIVENPMSAALSWSPSYPNQPYAVESNEQFIVTATFNGCSNQDTLSVYLYPEPQADFYYLPQEPTTLDSEVMFHLNNQSQNMAEIQWFFGDGYNSIEYSPVHLYQASPGDEFNVISILTNDYGCVDTASTVIIIKDILLFYIPNIFTPDGDQLNNTFQPVFTSGYDLYDYHMQIFNRWGELIFESYNANVGWDGSYGNLGLVQDGVYIWQVDFGLPQSDERIQRKGHVTVLK